jgi:hypothetical protein
MILHGWYPAIPFIIIHTSYFNLWGVLSSNWYIDRVNYAMIEGEYTRIEGFGDNLFGHGDKMQVVLLRTNIYYNRNLLLNRKQMNDIQTHNYRKIERDGDILIIFLFVFNGLFVGQMLGTNTYPPFFVAAIIYTLELIYVGYVIIKHRKLKTVQKLNVASP